MTVVARRRAPARSIRLDPWLEAVPVFRLSDSAESGALSFVGDDQTRWRVLPAPEERLPGTFDQDVYIELMRRYHEAGRPADGIVTFTLHAFLRSMGRRVDGRTYEQLRAALTRLERTAIEFTPPDVEETRRFSILTTSSVERRRLAERDQLPLFPTVASPDPGVARVALSPLIRDHVSGRNSMTLSIQTYLALQSPVARRLYRLIELARSRNTVTWRVGLERLREQLPLIQRFPSHLQRVLTPAHDMLLAAGILRSAAFRQMHREWIVDYTIASRSSRRTEE